MWMESPITRKTEKLHRIRWWILCVEGTWTFFNLSLIGCHVPNDVYVLLHIFNANNSGKSKGEPRKDGSFPENLRLPEYGN